MTDDPSGDPAVEPDPETRDSLSLIRRAKEGDRDALNRVLERYYDDVQRRVRRRLGPNLRQFVESGDIVQEAMVEAIRCFERFELDSSKALVALLAQIAENRIRAFVKGQGAAKRDRRREVALDRFNGSTSSGPNLDPADRGESPSQEVSLREEIDRYKQCLNELPDHYREIIEIRFRHDGETWEQTAERVGAPSGPAASQRWIRAKLELERIVSRSRPRP